MTQHRPRLGLLARISRSESSHLTALAMTPTLHCQAAPGCPANACGTQAADCRGVRRMRRRGRKPTNANGPALAAPVYAGRRWVTSSLRGRQRQTYWVTRTWPARGPFGLDSTLNVTLSPPRRESKLSTPSRWKKYSEPSDPAMNPKPRSDTSFLMVPFCIALISLLLEL